MIFKYEDKYLEELTDFILSKYSPQMEKAGFKMHRDKISELIKTCRDDIFVVYDGGIQGIIGGLIYAAYSELTSTVHVLVWCVDQAYRRYSLRLYREFENHCRKKGFARISISALFEDLNRSSKIYDRIGYKPMEMQFIKEI